MPPSAFRPGCWFYGPVLSVGCALGAADLVVPGAALASEAGGEGSVTSDPERRFQSTPFR